MIEGMTTSEQSTEIDLAEKVLAAHVLAEWREVSPESCPGADDGRYGRFCSCGQMLDFTDMDVSHRVHVAEQVAVVFAARLTAFAERERPSIKIDLTNDESKWLLDAAVTAAKAEALREVATDLGHIYQADSAGVTAAIHYLRLRADALTRSEQNGENHGN